MRPDALAGRACSVLADQAASRQRPARRKARPRSANNRLQNLSQICTSSTPPCFFDMGACRPAALLFGRVLTAAKNALDGHAT